MFCTFPFFLFQLAFSEILLHAGAGPNLFTQEIDGPKKLCFCNISKSTKCKEDMYGIIELLLRYGADVNSRDSIQGTCLHHCVRSGQTKLLQKLLTAGADANIKDIFDMTPLFDALARDSLEMVRMLLPKTDLNQTDLSGRTAIHVAAHSPKNPLSSKYIAMLIERGVDIDASAAWDGTALHLSVDGLNVEAVKVLVNSGCNLEA